MKVDEETKTFLLCLCFFFSYLTDITAAVICRFQILRQLIPHSDQKRDKASFLLEVGDLNYYNTNASILSLFYSFIVVLNMLVCN